MTTPAGLQGPGAARLQDAFERSQQVAGAVVLGVDRPTLIARIGEPTSTRHGADDTEVWTYEIDEGVSHNVYFDRDGRIEGHRFSGFDRLMELVGCDFSGDPIQPGDSD